MIENRSATKRITLTLIISFLAMFVNYVISFTLTPFITTYVGTDAYGFVTLAKTISNYGIIITGCLNAFASRYITIAYHRGDLKKANNYFSSVVIANIGMFFAVLLFEVFFIWKLQIFMKIPNELMSEVKILFALDITNYMLLAISNTFVASAYIKNRLDKIEAIKLVAYIVEAGVLVILFRFLPAKIYYVGMGLITSTFVLGICNYVLCKRNTPELQVSYKFFSWSAVKDLVVTGIINSINSIGNLLNSGLDLWVSNLMLSAVAMGELSIVKTVSTILSTLEQLVSRPFQPYLLKRYSDKDIDGLVWVFNIEIKFSGYVSSMIFAGLLCFGTVYYKLWTPTQNIRLLYGITVVTAIGFIFEGIVQPLFYTYTLTLKNKMPCYVTIISGILNVAGMYLLLKYTNLKLYAVVGTTTVLGFSTFIIFTPIYTSRCLGIKWCSFYRSIIRVFVAAGSISAVIYLIFKNHMPSSWIELIIDIIVSGIIGLPIFIICTLNKEDIKIIKSRILNHEKRRGK